MKMSKPRRKTRGHTWTNIKRRKATKKQVSRRINWLDLPRDIMILIFMKLGPIEIILNTQKVCFSWRKLSYEPQLFHTITVQHQQRQFLCGRFTDSKFLRFFKEAVDRSCGQLVRISFEDFSIQEPLEYVVSKQNSLKSLRIGMQVVGFSFSCFMWIVKKLPLLEELELSPLSLTLAAPSLTRCLFEVIGPSCPKLTHLRIEYGRSPPLDCDEHAFAIAKNMGHLRSLHLIRSKMTNKGLQAIREGCPYLESFDLN